jgi:hypothetical protein
MLIGRGAGAINIFRWRGCPIGGWTGRLTNFLAQAAYPYRLPEHVAIVDRAA